MKKYKLKNSAKAINIEDIQSIENKFGIKITDELKEIYLEFNGGEIEEERYIYINEDTDMEVSIKTFFPIKYKRRNGDTTIEERIEFFIKEKKLIPPHYIPFAMDDGGYPFCQNVKNGKIYLGYLEEFDGSESHMRETAPNLNHFISNMLTEEEAGW